MYTWTGSLIFFVKLTNLHLPREYCGQFATKLLLQLQPRSLSYAIRTPLRRHDLDWKLLLMLTFLTYLSWGFPKLYVTPNPSMTNASRLVSPFSSGLEPHPTVPSHLSTSHCVTPATAASNADPDSTNSAQPRIYHVTSQTLTSQVSVPRELPASVADRKFQVLMTIGTWQ